jgi:hypothetical protein
MKQPFDFQKLAKYLLTGNGQPITQFEASYALFQRLAHGDLKSKALGLHIFGIDCYREPNGIVFEATYDKGMGLIKAHLTPTISNIVPNTATGTDSYYWKVDAWEPDK